MSIVSPKFYWPLVITAANKAFKADIGAGTITINIAEGTYLSAASLATALATALNAGGFGGTAQVVYPTTSLTVAIGTIIISWPAPWSMIGTGNTLAPLLGMNQVDHAAVFDGGFQYVVTGDFQHANGFYPKVPPITDTLPIRNSAMNTVTRAASGQTKFILETELAEREWEFGYLPPERTYKTFEGFSGDRNKAIERLWDSGYARFRYFPNATSESDPLDYVLSLDSIQKFAPTRMYQKKALYSWRIKAWLYVS